MDGIKFKQCANILTLEWIPEVKPWKENEKIRVNWIYTNASISIVAP